MKAIKKYAEYYKKVKAIEEIMKELHPLVLRELKKFPDGKADSGGVEFHLTKKIERKYLGEYDELIKNLRIEIEKVKEKAMESGKVKIIERETFDAQIPRSAREQILATVSDYRKHFGIGG